MYCTWDLWCWECPWNPAESPIGSSSSSCGKKVFPSHSTVFPDYRPFVQFCSVRSWKLSAIYRNLVSEKVARSRYRRRYCRLVILSPENRRFCEQMKSEISSKFCSTRNHTVPLKNNRPSVPRVCPPRTKCKIETVLHRSRAFCDPETASPVSTSFDNIFCAPYHPLPRYSVFPSGKFPSQPVVYECIHSKKEMQPWKRYFTR